MEPPDRSDFFDIDRYLESCGTTTVRKSVGDPSYRPLADIPRDQLEGEVERILDLLEEHKIDVDLEECTPAEAYRYLTTEVMSAEIEDPRAPGWWICFIHSLRHPSPYEDDPPAERWKNSR